MDKRLRAEPSRCASHPSIHGEDMLTTSVLVGRPAPYQYNGQNFWECDYAIGNGYFAAAITPVPAAKLTSLVH
jgi:hypothetical protein